MNKHTIRTPLVLTTALLPLLWARLGAAQNINFSIVPDCGNPLEFAFPVPIGQPLNVTAAAEGTANPVAWEFDTVPNFTNPAAGTCVQTPAPPGTLSSACSGVTIALPDSGNFSTNPVRLTGTPANSVPDGAFVQFRLRATEQNTGEQCTRSYTLAFVGPRDIDLVLDRSGSMGLPADPSDPNGPSRYQVLTDVVSGFVPLVVSTATGGQLGISIFASNLVQSVPLAALGAGTSGAVNGVLAAQSPSGLTAMGQGVASAIGKVPSAANRRGVIMLFTDGEQNVAPLVNLNGTGLDNGTLIGNRRVVTVGIGNPSGNYLATLQNLASANGGSMLITPNGDDFSGIAPGGNPFSNLTLDVAFTTAVTPLLQGSSPQLVALFSDKVPPVEIIIEGEAPPPQVLGPYAFSVNQGASQLLLQLTVDEKRQPFQLESLLEGIVVEKGGVDFTQCLAFDVEVPATASKTGYLVSRFANSRCGELEISGDYEVTIPLPWLEDFGESSFPTQVQQFQLVAIADDHLLAFESFVPEETPRVGEAFTPTVDLAFVGAPLTNARVLATLSVPGDDLGDLLAKNPLVVQASTAQDAGSPGFQKYNALLNDPNFLASLAPSDLLLPLAHRGNGRYSAPFLAGDASGVYQVSYNVAASSSAFGRVQRIGAQSVYVRFGEVDLPASNVTVTPVAGGLTITFRPITVAIPGGVPRFLGPDQGDTFKVISNGIQLTNVIDQQDGTYQLVLTGDANTDVTVTVLGEPIFEGRAKDFGKKKRPHGHHARPHHAKPHRPYHQYWHPGHSTWQGGHR